MKRANFHLTCLVASFLLAACKSSSAVTPTAPVVTSGPSVISVAVASNDFGEGKPRLPFVLFHGATPISDAQDVRLIAFDLSTGTPVPGWSGSAIGYSDYEIPYWVAYPELPASGQWGMVAVIKLADGTETDAQFVITVVPTPSAPSIGETPPASENRTLASEPDITKLTSDPDPEAGLYQLRVSEALESGKPTVVVFATPGFCESRLCAPVVNSIKPLYSEFKDSINFIHIDVYKSFDPLVYAEEMEEWELQSEPWTFVLDQNGQTVARLGGPVSPRELRAVLEPLLAP